MNEQPPVRQEDRTKRRFEEELNSHEERKLEGMLNIEIAVEDRAAERRTALDLEDFATDLYEEAFKPFGFPSREYRNTNSIFTDSELNCPDYHFVPRLMSSLGKKAGLAFKEAQEDTGNVDKVLSLATIINEVTHIQPFFDGNKRITRGLISYVFQRFGYYPPVWLMRGRDGYLDAIIQGKENPQVFKNYLAEGIVENYNLAIEKLDREYKGLTEKKMVLMSQRKMFQDYQNDGLSTVVA